MNAKPVVENRLTPLPVCTGQYTPARYEAPAAGSQKARQTIRHIRTSRPKAAQAAAVSRGCDSLPQDGRSAYHSWNSYQSVLPARICSLPGRA